MYSFPPLQPADNLSQETNCCSEKFTKESSLMACKEFKVAMAEKAQQEPQDP